MSEARRGPARRRSRAAGGAAIAGGVLLGALAVIGLRRARRRSVRQRVEARRGGLPRVVILGGGTGGLFCALALAEAPVETVVIDRVNHFLYEALIYQVATGRLDEGDVTLPLRDEMERVPNASVMLADVVGIDLGRHEVYLRDAPHTVLYDYLVVATGLEPHYFGHDDWARHAPALKTLADALDLRDRVLADIETAERLGDRGTHPELTTFVLVGGGPTGVELAAALSEMFGALDPREFDRFDPASVRIVLVEAAPRVLPTFSAEISERACRRLEEMGVAIRVGRAVETIDAEGVIVGGERIASRNVVWTAGFRATPLGRLAGTPTDSLGRLKVEADLTLPGHPDAYAVGDIARVEQDGRPLPALAPVAIDEGRFAARSIARKAAGRASAERFRYVDLGEVASVGRTYGVWEAFGSRVKLTGPAAKVVWSVAHLLLQVPKGDKARMFSKWTWSSFVPRMRAKVITGPKSIEAEKAERAAVEGERETTPALR
jgi:NADH:ubiquinone reductase (H+-translocating)